MIKDKCPKCGSELDKTYTPAERFRCRSLISRQGKLLESHACVQRQLDIVKAQRDILQMHRDALMSQRDDLRDALTGLLEIVQHDDLSPIYHEAEIRLAVKALEESK